MPALTIAVAGASASEHPFSSNLGGHFTQALIANGATVKVLARKESAEKPKIQELKKAGATIYAVDYSDAKTLDDALKGADIVLSTLAWDGWKNQTALADAAKRAGAKLFLPSEYGPNTFLDPEGLKGQLQSHLKSMGLPSLLIFTGPLSQAATALLAQKDGKIMLPGGGKESIGFTDIEDLIPYVGYVLTHIPIDQLKDRVLYLQSDRKSLRELAQVVQKRDPSVKIEDSPLEGYKERMQQGSLFDYLLYTWNTPEGCVVGTPEQIKESVALYPPGFKNRSVTEFA